MVWTGIPRRNTNGPTVEVHRSAPTALAIAETVLSPLTIGAGLFRQPRHITAISANDVDNHSVTCRRTPPLQDPRSSRSLEVG